MENETGYFTDSFMSCLDYLPVYSTGGFQALQLIVLVVYGASRRLTTYLLCVGPIVENLV